MSKSEARRFLMGKWEKSKAPQGQELRRKEERQVPSTGGLEIRERLKEGPVSNGERFGLKSVVPRKPVSLREHCSSHTHKIDLQDYRLT